MYLASDSIHICQIGKSYIYQIRDNKIIHRYIDSSDQILQGNKKLSKINLITIKDIQSGDQFFISQNNACTFQDEEIVCNILSTIANAEEKLSNIKKYYLNKYQSTFSGHLIPIREVRENPTLKQRVNALVYSFI